MMNFTSLESTQNKLNSFSVTRRVLTTATAMWNLKVVW